MPTKSGKFEAFISPSLWVKLWTSCYDSVGVGPHACDKIFAGYLAPDASLGLVLRH
jgi:hypothetical protein